VFFSEVAASLYPWNLADEGIERILDKLEEMTGCNSVYLVALMHHEKRPLTDYYFPHNPARKTYFPEDSRAYYRPDPKFYGRIKPRTSDRDFLKGVDWPRVLIEAARKRGMKTGLELSHTPLDVERSRGEFSDCIQRDIYGKPFGQELCLNNPDVQEYVAGIFCDFTANYDVDYVQTCLRNFDAGPSVAVAYPNTRRRDFAGHDAGRVLLTTLGACFCESCAGAAREAGIDFDKIKATLKPIADSIAHSSLEQAHENSLLLASSTSPTTILLETPEMFQWLQFRRDSLTRCYRNIHERAHQIRSSIDVRLNTSNRENLELYGVDFRSLRPHLDSIRSSNYDEQSGEISRLEHKRAWLLSVRRAVGDDMHFISALAPRPLATPEIIRQSVVVSAECGVDGIAIGHYDNAPFPLLRAVKEGLDLAGVEVRAQPGGQRREGE
jgi:hypothetical protein